MTFSVCLNSFFFFFFILSSSRVSGKLWFVIAALSGYRLLYFLVTNTHMNSLLPGVYWWHDAANKRHSFRSMTCAVRTHGGVWVGVGVIVSD